MNDCESRSTEPAQASTATSAPDPAVIDAYGRGYRDCARDFLAELSTAERATLLRQVSAPKE